MKAKPSAHHCTPGFLKLLWSTKSVCMRACACVCVCVCVCVSTPEGINDYSCEMKL